MDVGSISSSASSPALQAAQSLQTVRPTADAGTKVDNDGDFDNNKPDTSSSSTSSLPSDPSRGRNVNTKA